MARLRRAAFLLAAAWMLLSPAYEQLLGGRSGLVASWRMYHQRGGGICAARYQAGGAPIDRFAVLGVPRSRAPADLRRITSEAQARAIGKRLCRHLGTDLAVTVELRCADQRSFHTPIDRDEDLCAR